MTTFINRGLLITSAVLALALSLYHVVVAYIGPPTTEVHRATHLMLGLAVLFCMGTIPANKERHLRSALVDVLLLCGILIPSLYLVLNIEAINARMIYVTPVSPLELALGAVLTVSVLEATRRLLGWPMVILAVIFLIYTQLGPYLPYPFWHRGYALERVIEQIFLSLDGLWGIPIGASANYIFLFVLFGALLVASGAGAFFSRFANAFAGRFVGGPAKTAVLSSAFMSMLSGSSTANVVTTGSFTIPAMKSYGYRKEFAGGVEALASTGGLITPPVMGAAAFIMADFLGVSYAEIMAAAAIPALLYFVAIFMSVDLEARRNRLEPAPQQESISVGALLVEGLFMLIPLAIMVYFLIAGYTPTLAGLYGIISFVIALCIRKIRAPKEIVSSIWAAMIEAPRMVAPVIAACAIGGIIAGVISLTGLGVRFTSIIALVAGDSRMLFLVFTMIASIILGMGMPTSAVYIVLASILAPGLIELGFEPLAAHMFIFFGAVMSNITPPLAIASFAAAAVANADPWKTSIAALKIASGVFLLPFIFCYSPALLGLGSSVEIAQAGLSALLGMLCLSIAAIGWFMGELGRLLRLALAAAAVALILPGMESNFIGFVTAGAILVFQYLRQRQSGTAGVV